MTDPWKLEMLASEKLPDGVATNEVSEMIALTKPEALTFDKETDCDIYRWNVHLESKLVIIYYQISLFLRFVQSTTTVLSERHVQVMAHSMAWMILAT